MATRAEATLWGRPSEILLGEELNRTDAFIDLLLEVVELISFKKNEPTPLEWIAARMAAAAIWRCDRETSDGNQLKLLLAEPSYSLKRQNVFRDSDERVRFQRLHAEAVGDALELLKAVRQAAVGSSGGEVLPFNPAARKEK